VVPDSYRAFFAAEAGASAALVGLLFVAISVAADRIVGDRAPIVEQARASSALTAFIIPLALSLVSLLPGARLGIPATIVSFAGILFVAATVRRYLSVDKGNREDPRGLVGLIGFTLVVVVIFGYGIVGIIHPNSTAPTAAIAGATVACVLLGVDRAWALIGGRGRGRGSSLRDLVKGEDPDKR
jgi:hypothetical protein